MTRFEIPIRTARGGNNREHPMARHRRVKAERLAVALLFPRALKGAGADATAAQPLVVTLTRVSAGTLDGHDNLRGALKGPVDELAAQLGVDDGDARVQWRYAQAPGPRGRGSILVEVRP